MNRKNGLGVGFAVALAAPLVVGVFAAPAAEASGASGSAPFSESGPRGFLGRNMELRVSSRTKPATEARLAFAGDAVKVDVPLDDNGRILSLAGSFEAVQPGSYFFRFRLTERGGARVPLEQEGGVLLTLGQPVMLVSAGETGVTLELVLPDRVASRKLRTES